MPQEETINNQVPNTPSAADVQPAANIPVIQPENRDFATRDELQRLRDTIAGIRGNIQQDLQLMRSEFNTGLSALTTTLGELNQPARQAPAQTPPTNARQSAEPESELASRVAQLEQMIRLNNRMSRLQRTFPDLSTNQAVVTLVESSTLEDDALFNLISGLQTAFAVSNQSEVSDDGQTPTESVTEQQPASAAANPPQTGTQLVGNNDDIPEGVPPVNQPFSHAGETVAEQMTELYRQGDMDGTLNLISQQLETGALNIGQTFGQARRNNG